MCGFMPLRASIASDPRRLVPLRREGDVTLELQQDQDADAAALSDVLGTGRADDRSVAWTGVRFTDESATSWLFLWLTCTVPGGLCGLVAQQSAVDDGVLPPRSRLGTMAAVAGDSVAYLTSRPDPAAGRPGGRRAGGGRAGGGREMGVIGHGPGGQRLADQIAEQARIWDQHYRTRAATFTIRPAEEAGAPEQGWPGEAEFTFRTPHNQLTIHWR
jgi:protein-L-isoaspartate(D-aspartate) O-methyltransferase